MARSASVGDPRVLRSGLAMPEGVDDVSLPGPDRLPAFVVPGEKTKGTLILLTTVRGCAGWPVLPRAGATAG